MMKFQIYKAASRGFADHGWLKAKHSFSFANYYHPDKVHFGALRVLNDDEIAGGGGFPKHPHDNMEIITIPLSGSMAHEDSMGNASTIRAGEIQVMSAGTGIFHSEFNASKEVALNLFQIWIFPNKKNVTPRYDQIKINTLNEDNELFQILSPHKDDDGVWIHQDAWFHMGKYSIDKEETYALKKNGNGLYIMVIDGEIELADTTLKKRDAIAISNTQKVNFKTNIGTKVLLIEVPLKW